MNIQIISHSGSFKINTKCNVTKSSINNPKSFDEFDLNIIELNDEKIWQNKNRSIDSVNCIYDFKTLNTLIKNSEKKVLVFLPQNIIYRYDDNYSGGYDYNVQIKDVVNEIFRIIKNSILNGYCPNDCNLIFDNCCSIINSQEVASSFAFNSPCNALTCSKSGNKPTTITISDKIILSTLPLNKLNLDVFLNQTGLDKSKSKIPNWIESVLFYNDNELNEKLKEENERKRKIEQIIKNTKNALGNNLKYKSILYTNGQELVNVVFDILQEILNYNLEEFEDVKKEDFLIKKENVTFIGEIKGVTCNVKSEFVSQVDVHLQGYADKLVEEDVTENLKSILIINPFRTKAPSERDEVHEIQINLATRNNCLIITTEMLLKIYEKFLQGQITSENIIKLFTNKSGILTENDF